VTDVWPTTVAALLELYERRGDEPYGEAVCQRAHALQCAALASEDGADDALVAAALLHDVGHLLAQPRLASWRDDVDDDRHEALGARALGALFGSTVTAPVALHVTAKRWRCATDPGYLSGLSATSRATLVAQGGPLGPAAATRFEAHRAFEAAVRLRTWDDAAKDPRRPGGSLLAHRGLLEGLATPRA